MTPTTPARTPAVRTKKAKAAANSDGYTRLHITPLDADLLCVVLSATLRSQAQNISFHTVETFPDRRYGFVELPNMEADKLKKKLNGAVLRGSKIRIDTARPDSIPAPGGEEALPTATDPAATDSVSRKKLRERKEKKDKTKKRKRTVDGEELQGVLLEDGRKVKRGWTVSEAEMVKTKTDKKKRKEEEKTRARDKDDEKKEKKEKRKHKRETKSKYTDGPECLMKTVLPPNAIATAGPEIRTRSKSGKKSREAIVHEFQNTTKFPAFLRVVEPSASKASGDTKFVEGKGWVDQDGKVVEAVNVTRPTIHTQPVIKTTKARKAVIEDNDDETSSSRSSSSDDDSDDSSDTSEASDASESESVAEGEGPRPSSPADSQPARPRSSGSAKSLSIWIPPPPITPGPAKVHPLEALYKRPKPDAVEGDNDAANETMTDAQPFSFFGSADEEEGEGETHEGTAPPRASQPPMTPFTRHDFESRNIRSAAPTPDTAMPSRKFMFFRDGTGDDDDEADEDEDEDGGTAMGVESQISQVRAQQQRQDSSPTAEKSEFQTWFWEHRGELNRAWKRRRKVAAKEKRYRQNRARAGRAV